MSVWDHFEEAHGDTFGQYQRWGTTRNILGHLAEVGTEIDRLDLVVDKLADVPGQVIGPGKQEAQSLQPGFFPPTRRSEASPSTAG